MTDPLSVAAGIAGLIGLASELTKTCYSYYKKVENAPAAVKDVIDEIRLMRKVLSDLEDICDQRAGQIPALDHFLKDLADCENKIVDFGLKIDKDFHSPQRLAKRLAWPFRGTEVKLFLAQVQRYRATFESAKTNAILDVVLDVQGEFELEAAKQDAVRKDERRKAILDWLSPLDFRDQQEDYYEVRREPGTSEWVEHASSFTQWRDWKLTCDDPKQVLWATGSPGSGKTISCSVLIHRLSLMSGNVALGYIYCNRQQRGLQTPENIVGSLIKQMASLKIRGGMLPRFLEDYYDASVGSGRPRLIGLSSLLSLTCRSFSKVFIVVDGFDELEEEVQEVLIEESKRFFKQTSARLLISSRPHTPRLGFYLAPAFSLTITGQATDICKVVKSRIKKDYKLQMIIAGDSSLTEGVAASIADLSQGQFTIAAMHLRKISEATNKAALLNLEYLPTTLQQYYVEAMQTIKTQPVSHLKLARNTFALMSRAKDSLKVKELQEALCVATGDHKLDCSQLTPFPIILNVCLGFINSDRQSKVVDFFHVTFQEWLLASWDAWSELQPDIGQRCLTYLMLEDFSEPCNREDLIVARRQQYPFAAYASRFWADHIRGKSEWNLQEPLLHFLLSPNVVSSLQLLPQNASRDVRLMGKPIEWLEITESNDHIALYLSICLRLEKTLAALLQRGFAPPLLVPWGERYSPLHAALRLRSDEICKKLIMKGTWTDVRDRRGMTPLHLALEMSGSALTLHARLLMSTAKARIDIPDCEGRTALHCAIRADNSSAVQYMLKNYTSIDASSWDIAGNTPFHEAIYQKNSRMIGILISNNFSPMVQNRAGKSALAVAIENSDPTARSIVEQILRAADHPNACFQLPAPELAAGVAFLESLKEQEANARRSAAAVKASVEKQQAQRGPDRLGRLAKASREGNIRDLVILILNGVKLNVVDPASGMTPLQHAVSTGQTEAAWHLLAAGADHSVNDPQGLSARDMAERDGRKEILSLFYSEAWMSVERPVGEVPYEREMSGRELREVYAHAEEVVQIKREYEYSDTSWSYRGTDWFEYLGFHGGHRALTSRH